MNLWKLQKIFQKENKILYNMTKNIAHLVIEKNGNIREQTLSEHNQKVGRYAAESLTDIGLSQCGMLTGILHDGKGTDRFQEYLRQSAAWNAYGQGIIDRPAFHRPRRGTVNHTFAGVIYLFDRYYKGDKTEPFTRYTVEILSAAIGSHHGLFDCENLEGINGFYHRVKEVSRDDIQYEQARKAFEEEISTSQEIGDLFEKARNEIRGLCTHIFCLCKKYTCSHKNENHSRAFINLYISFTTRLISSALMYADRRDTAEFSDQTQYPEIMADWKRDIEDFERKYSRMLAQMSEKSTSFINQVRANISEQCMNFAQAPEGIYQLDVPTGGGKTLASLRYALHHAQKYSKKKIIYVIPLLTIIDQNAEEIKSFIPNETILEHHSDVILESENQDELQSWELMRDRWSAPVIITTLVQILEIFFSGKTSSVTRFRSLCNSIIIFDEVQSVPTGCIAMFNSVLNFLYEICGATVILCSATQPEFQGIKDYALHLSEQKIVRLSRQQMRAFHRHCYINQSETELTLEEMSNRALEIAEKCNPLMIVCNTKSEARQLYEHLKELTDNFAIIKHLSAGMCKAHRKEIIEDVKTCLRQIQTGEEKRLFILVTTQLVEAGVNFSFHSVIRVLAGNDNLVQTGGRCNRSNEYGAGEVYLIRLSGEQKSLKKLPDIQKAQNAMLNTLHWLCDADSLFDPENPEFISDYYNRLYAQIDRSERLTGFPFQYKNGKTYHMVDLLGGLLARKGGRDYSLLRQPFKTAGEYFSVFDENTYEVLVPFKEGKKLIEEIRHLEEYNRQISGQMYKKTSEYSVQIYEWQREMLERNGMLEKIYHDRLLILHEDAYDDSLGVNVESEWKTDDLII